MTPENAEKLSVLADTLDAVLYIAKMRFTPEIHLRVLTGEVRAARDICAAIVREETGEDPWETSPLEG